MHHTVLYEFSPVAYGPGLTSPLKTFVAEARIETLQALSACSHPLFLLEERAV